MSKHTIQGAIRSLSQKGAVITEETPITKRETRYKEISIEEVKKKAEAVGLSAKEIVDLTAKGKLLTTLGVTPEKVLVQVTVQEAFTINIGDASNLGNKSWGKIDFLKQNGFKLIKQPLYGATAKETA